MAPTDQTILDNIKTAINNILVGGAVKSYSIGGRDLERMTLKELEDLRSIYESRVNSATKNRTRTYGSFTRPS